MYDTYICICIYVMYVYIEECIIIQKNPHRKGCVTASDHLPTRVLEVLPSQNRTNRTTSDRMILFRQNSPIPTNVIQWSSNIFWTFNMIESYEIILLDGCIYLIVSSCLFFVLVISHSYGNPPFSMDMSTISMVISHSYVKLPEGTRHKKGDDSPIENTITGLWFQPLRKIWVSWDDEIPNWMGK